MKTLAKRYFLAFLLLILFTWQLSAQKANPFFVFHNAVTDSQYNTAEKQVELVKSMGFSGMEQEGIDGLSETLKALNKHKLKLYTMYINVDIDNPEQAYDGRLEDVFKLLKGRGTMPWFYVTSKKYKPSDPSADPIAVNTLQKIADLASKYGIKVMVYPHKDYWIERVDDAVRIATQVNRKNFGLTFNLCHYLAVEGLNAEARFIPTVEKAMPYLFAISVNGADSPTASNLVSSNVWEYFIQPLDKGNFDNFKYIEAFLSRGFKGPVGLQCYNIKEEKSIHLKRSVNTWNTYLKKLNR
jgi:sugar phosphate isomerase/epimerase